MDSDRRNGTRLDRTCEEFMHARLKTLRGDGFPKDHRGSGIGELLPDKRIPKLTAPTAFPIDHTQFHQMLLEQGGVAPDGKERERFIFYFNLFFDPTTISYIDSSGRDELLRYALECSFLPKQMSTIQVRVGLGIHDGNDHSARLPAYIYPLVQIYKKLFKFYGSQNLDVNDLNLYPRARIYSAAESVINANNLNQRVATENRDFYFLVLRKYLGSELSSFLHECFAFPCDDKVLIEEQSDWTQKQAETLMAERGEHPAVKKILSTAARKNADPIESLRYGVAHAIYSIDPIGEPFRSFFKDESRPPDRLIMMGGEGEIPYWQLRQLLRDTNQKDLSRVQMITRTGALPPYTGPQEGDLSVKSLFADNDALSSVSRAFDVDIKTLTYDRPNGLEYLRSLWTSNS